MSLIVEYFCITIRNYWFQTIVIALEFLVNTPSEVRLCDEAGIDNLLSCGVTSQENSCVKSGLSTEITQNFSLRQPIHIYKEGTRMGLLLGGGVYFVGHWWDTCIQITTNISNCRQLPVSIIPLKQLW